MRHSGRALRAAVRHVRKARPGVDVGYVVEGADDSYEVTVGGQASAGLHQVIGYGIQPGDPVLRLRQDRVQDPSILGLSPYHSGTDDPPVVHV